MNKTLRAALLLGAALAIPAYAQTSYPGTTGLVPPTGTSGTSVFTADVMGAGGVLNDIEVSVNMTHTFMGDLDITLESPAGTTVQLWDSDCSSSDDLNGVFADGGAGAGTVCGPTTGSIGPSGPGTLDDFDGEDPNGTWTLTIVDNAAGDSGNVAAWSVDIDAAGVAAPGASTSTLILTVMLIMASSAFLLVRK